MGMRCRGQHELADMYVQREGGMRLHNRRLKLVQGDWAGAGRERERELAYVEGGDREGQGACQGLCMRAVQDENRARIETGSEKKEFQGGSTWDDLLGRGSELLADTLRRVWGEASRLVRRGWL